MRRRMTLLVLLLCPCHVALGAELTLSIKGVTPGDGVVRIGIYERGEAFAGSPLYSEKLAPEATLLQETVADLEPGQYAAAAYQDSNGSGSMDRNFFGAPSEPYGFSHGARGTLGPPDFDDAMFSLGSEPVEIHVPLE